jgi:hypothetical protein
MTLDDKRREVKTIVEEFQHLCLDKFLQDCEIYDGLNREIPIRALKDQMEVVTRLNTYLGLFLLGPEVSLNG